MIRLARMHGEGDMRSGRANRKVVVHVGREKGRNVEHFVAMLMQGGCSAIGGMMLGSDSAWLMPLSGMRWPSIRIRVELDALAPRPWMVGASVPAPSAEPNEP